MRVLPLLLLTLLAGPAAAQGSEAPAGCQEDNSDCREDCTVEYGSSTRTYSKLGTCLQRCKQKYDKCRESHYAIQEKEKLGIEPQPGPKPTPAPSEPSHRASTDEGSFDDEAPASASSSRPASSSSDGRSGVYHSTDDAAETPAAQATGSKSAAEKKTAPTPSPKAEAVEPSVRRDVYRASTPEPEPVKAPEPKAPAKSEATAKSEPVKPAEPAKPPEPAKPIAKSEPAVTAKATPSEPVADDDPPPPPPPPKPQPAKTEAPRPKPPPEPKKDISDWDPNGD